MPGNLVMPTDSVFLDRQRAAKASVILKLNRDGLSKDQGQAIARLVAGAVDELQPEDVSIIDADTDRSLGSGHNGEDAAEGVEQTLTQRLADDEFGLRHRPLGSVDQHEHPIDHAEDALHLTAKIGVTGSINDIDLCSFIHY